MLRRLHTTNKLQSIIIILAVAIPLILSLVQILSINLTFWYDNARDLLAAWDNLSKLTLLGPTSGIPGIFYGPYWIWLLSFGLLFSKNPLIVTIITATIPYFILFPFVWFRLNKFFDWTSLLIGWLLFVSSKGINYGTSLWNLYPAPLIAISTIYFLSKADFNIQNRKQTAIATTIGFLIGLLINFHISFGLSFVTGTIIFLIADTFITFLHSPKKAKQKIVITKLYSFLFIIIGLLISFFPTLLFEIRHGFHQTQMLLHTLFNYGGGIVKVTGMNKAQILTTFIKTFGDLLFIPTFYAGFLLIILITTYCYFVYKQKVKVEKSDKRILLLLSSLFTGNLFIYLTAKNPVWDYHFVGVDILFLLLLTFFSTKLSFFRKVLILYALIIISIITLTFILNFHKHASHFEQQEDAVKIIKNDAGKNSYTEYAYNASIYSYDFSYLFRWLANKDAPYDPGQIKQASNIIYLIVPMWNNAYVEDFIHFRSQPRKYKQVKMWKTETDFRIFKYVKR